MKTLNKTINLLLALFYLAYATYILIALWANWTINPKIITIGAMSGFLAMSNWFFERLKD